MVNTSIVCLFFYVYNCGFAFLLGWIHFRLIFTMCQLCFQFYLRPCLVGGNRSNKTSLTPMHIICARLNTKLHQSSGQ